MDGSSLSLVLIPVVVVISLAAWLITVAYAASHPTWKHGPATPQTTQPAAPADIQIPQPRTEVPQPRTEVPQPRTEVPQPRAEIPQPARQPAETRPLAAAGHAAPR